MAKNRTYRSRLPGLIGAVCASTLSLSTAFADDTEVFFGQVDPDLDIFPNVLFVLDTSGSMNSTDNTSSTRLERMKDALDTILDNTTNVNVGIMRFNGSQGGGAVLFPVTPIDQEICEQGACGKQSAAPQASGGSNDVEEASDGDIMISGNVLGLGVSERGPEVVGVRFQNLNIPQGAQITAAKLEFTAHQDSTGDADLEIRGHLHEDSPVFTNADYDVTSRTPTLASVDWSVEEWSQGLTYQSEDVSDVLQEIVDQGNWCGGNSVSLFVSGTGNRDARSFDQSASDAPKLKFTYDASNVAIGQGCVNQTIVKAITTSTDDAEQRTVRGNTYTNSTDLELPYDRSIQQTVGLRFTDINIPKNSEITEASIEFEVDRQRWGTLSLNVHGEAADNPVTYRSKWRNITNRPLTSESVQWTDIPSPATNSKLTVEGLEDIVQELVDRNGWAAGNAMAFVISQVSGTNYRELESFDGEPANAPKLRIRFKALNDGSEPTVITARDKLKEVVNGLTATGGTPIVDAYYEAARYYRGLSVDYGKKRGYWGNRYHRVSVPESYTGGTVDRKPGCTDDDLDSWDCYYEHIDGNPTYISPFKSSCQTNHIVFLSDGAATSNSAASKVKSMIGMPSGETCSNNRSAEHCGEELGAWLNDTDHSSFFNGKQNISTYTIGFNFSSDFLKDIASAGGGSYFQASSSAQLVDVFQSILGDVLSVDTSFVAPGATVNQFNRLTHRSDIYFALFKPDQRPVWSGNLKRYEVAEKDGEIKIVDANGDEAVDADSGFFKETSESHWLPANAEVDGNQVAKGGAAMRMDYSTQDRNIFTYVGDYSSIPSTGITLTNPANWLHENNNNITIEHLGIADNTGTNDELLNYRTSLLKWARGLDVKDEDEDNDTTDWRMHMGDPMHARPVILNYASGSGPETLVFVGTNEGYLHAFENVNGFEEFSFVPKDLLPNFDTFWNNQASDPHPYGLDGTLSVWTTDVNENVTIDPGEKAFLYTGMRRGGSNYYALDVSDKSSPKLSWVIEGGTTGFEELGQTWSKMTPAKIRFNGQERDVLIFGAGYHDNQDWSYDPIAKTQKPRTPDSKGRGFYIVDAETGERLYAALGSTTGDQVFTDMNYSMPANLRIIDTDFDGFADQIYASDTGGQIWRFDFKQYHESGDLLQGGVLANLSGAGAAGERRFYYEPDVAIISDNGNRFLSISIGSGWRAHPLDVGTDDRFYMIKSPHLFDAPAGYGKSTDGTTFSPITESDLVNITYNTDAPPNAYGWMYDLGATGEKVLGASVTANNRVIFTSYRPALSVGACTTAIGGGSIYALNILNGAAAMDMDGDGDIDESDREKPLAHGGIPPEPAVLITEKGPVLLAGPEQFDPDIDQLTERTFWVDQGNEE